MRVVLICPANLLYMPYIENYKGILEDNKVPYTIINWDRFQIENDKNELSYKDSKIGHQRGFLDYYLFKKFVIKKLEVSKFDKVIVFGLQLSFFLKNYLIKNFKGNYVIDIRDHNKIVNYFKMNRLFKNSAFTVISSPGYQQFLPEGVEYLINHNCRLQSFDEVTIKNHEINQNKIRVACIGALRDFDVNISFINYLKDKQEFELFFHGEGQINNRINDYIQLKGIANVFLTGRYMKEQEEELYENSDLINVLRYSDSINNRTALPNRLYNSAKYCKPMIALNGSYLAEEIDKYKLGLVLDSFEEMESKINDYVDLYDVNEYENGRQEFFNMVFKDNNKFIKRLEGFIL